MSHSNVVRLAAALGVAAGLWHPAPASADVTLQTVTYGAAEKFYDDYNQAFARHWKETTGETVTIQQSHGTNGDQVKSVTDGAEADIVAPAVGYEVDAIREAGFITGDWEQKFPHHSSPLISTVVFVVRKGNPKQIHDWSDLVKTGVSVITPTPTTSRGGRWNYLAAWGYAKRLPGGDDEKAREFVARLYKNVPTLDAHGSGSHATFVEKGAGDVLLAYEVEALKFVEGAGKGQYELVEPPTSIRVVFPVSLVDKAVDRHGTRKLATAYVEYLYSNEAQAIAARHGYRPRDEAAIGQSGHQFATLSLFSFYQEFGGWQKANQTHFAGGGTFAQIARAGQ